MKCCAGGELRLVEKQKSILRWQYRRHGRARRRVFNKRRHRLALIQGKGGDINKPCDLWIVAGFCDYRSAVGVANENHGTAMRGQNALGYGHIIRERYRWILNYAYGVPILLQDFVDFFPAGAVHEAAVDENYCLYSRIRFALHNFIFYFVDANAPAN